MPRFALTLVGLLAALPATTAPAQWAEQSGVELQQAFPAVQPPAEGWPDDQIPLADPAITSDVPVPIDAPPTNAVAIDPLGGFLGYRYEASSVDWIIGGGDQFGMVSLIWDHYQQSGVAAGLGIGLEFHFLAGPEKSDMPPRVFDFSIGYQHRDRLGPFGYDVATSVMASSDFEGSAREGIRFPSHAVGFLQAGPAAELVFGIDYLHRGDIKLLPVGGLILLPHPDLRFEIVFPRPRIVFRVTDESRLYAAGELGGGTWAIERQRGFDDLATYRDLRLTIGLESSHSDGRRSALEIGYLFDRKLEYTSRIGDMRLEDAAMVRLVTAF